MYLLQDKGSSMFRVTTLLRRMIVSILVVGIGSNGLLAQPTTRGDVERTSILELPLSNTGVLPPVHIIKLCSTALTKRTTMKASDIVTVLHHRAVAFSSLKDYSNAKQDLDEAIRLSPQDPELRIHRATVLSGLGLHSDAMKELDLVLSKDPKHARALTEKAYVLFYQRDLGSAMKSATKAIELDASNPYPYQLRGQIHLIQGNYEDSIRDLSRCIGLSPLIYKGHPYYLRGKANIALGKTTKAVDDFLIARQLNPSFSSTYEIWAVYHMQHRYSLCYQLLPELQRLGSDKPKAYVASAVTLNHLDRHDDAMECLARALRLDANNVDALVEMGNTYEYKRNYDSAIKHYDLAISADSEDTNALKSKAMLLAACPLARYRNGKQARTLAVKACELSNWEDPRCTLALAIAYAECGDFEEACTFAKKSRLLFRVDDACSRDICDECESLFHNRKYFRLDGHAKEEESRREKEK